MDPDPKVVEKVVRLAGICRMCVTDRASCPRCGKRAKGVGPVDALFGWRRHRGVFRPQGICRECLRDDKRKRREKKRQDRAAGVRDQGVVQGHEAAADPGGLAALRPPSAQPDRPARKSPPFEHALRM